MTRIRGAQVCVSLAAMALAACATSPTPRPSAVPPPAQWSEPLAGQRPAASPESAWWHEFHDPELDSLIARAVTANLDVQRALASVREARALYRASGAPRWPTIDASASALRQRESAHAPAPVLPGPGGSLQPESGATENLFQGGFDASWEIDLYGAHRMAMDAAQADLQSAVDEHDTAVLSLTAEIARSYIELRSLQAQRITAQALIASLEDSLVLTRARATGGLAGDLDVNRAEARLQDARSRGPALQALAVLSIHRLAVLLALPPTALQVELELEQPMPQPPGSPALGLPSDLLRARPDIRSAEHRVAAAQARAGLARTDLFPKFSLLGTAGFASIAASDFLNGASAAWSVGPTITWPIFKGGEIRATIEVRDVQTQKALIQYRQTILTALADVEDTLSAYRSEELRKDGLAEVVLSNQRTLDAATSLYRAGHTDFRRVLDAQRSLLEAHGALADSNASLSIDFIALCKALGSGWAAVNPAVASRPVDRLPVPATAGQSSAQ